MGESLTPPAAGLPGNPGRTELSGACRAGVEGEPFSMVYRELRPCPYYSVRYESLGREPDGCRTCSNYIRQAGGAP